MGGMSTGRLAARGCLLVSLATGADSGTVAPGPSNADEPLRFVETGQAGDWAGGGGVRAANSAAVAIPRGVAARAREGVGMPKYLLICLAKRLHIIIAFMESSAMGLPASFIANNDCLRA